MKKNNKGFVLLETLIVATFVLGTLIFLYIQFSNVKRNYEISFRYNTVPNLYNLKTLTNYLNNNGYNEIYDNYLGEENGYLDITSCVVAGGGSLCDTILQNMNVKKAIFIGNDITDLQNYLKKSSYDKNLFDQEFRSFILSMETKSINTKNRIVVEFNDNTFATVSIGSLVEPEPVEVCNVETGTIYTFDEAKINEFSVPCTGRYKLELWGASGATTSYGTNPGAGKGGYATGTAKLRKGTVYVVVGGQGVSTGAYASASGYNGGGTAPIPGGGATHIAKITGTLAEIGESNKSKVIIVAGGGGGTGSSGYANTAGAGGAGGGISGLAGADSITSAASCIGGGGGTQTAGGAAGSGTGPYEDYTTPHAGSFGQGGDAGGWNGPGGGGGYYGGGSGFLKTHNFGSTGFGPGCGSGGGGGSSYIGGVSNGQTIAGSASMPTHDGTSTMTGNTGNGYAKITYLGN